MPIQTDAYASADTANAEIANQLNAEWDEFGAEFDKYAYTMSEKSSKTIQESIAKWQDWYYGNYDAWPDPASWYFVLEKAKAILSTERMKDIKALEEDPYIDKPLVEAPVELDPIYIYGKVPKFQVDNGTDPFAPSLAVKGKSKFPWGWVVAGVAAVVYYGSQKKKGRK